MPRFKNIVCPVDFSDNSRRALTIAIELAKSSDGTLTLVHVWQPIYGTMDGPISGDVIQSFVNDAERMLRDCETAAKKEEAKTLPSKFIIGVAWDEIVRLASQAQADLIVMGTQGRTGLKHVLIGSVAEKVVRHAPCAVLVTR
ncbi:MAG TPA: universal stress protein [Kofleriaceae bacterium]|nr:universal stress protein [Kofleriaceae bacterium]